MNLYPTILLGLASIPFILSADPEVDVYDDPTKPHRERLRETAVKAFHDEGPEAAEAALADYLREMVESGMRERQVYGAAWREAQLHAGSESAALAEVFYRWILLDSTDGDLSGAVRPHSGLVLLGNLISSCERQGKLAESRRWTAFAARLLARKGIATDTGRYADRGPLYDWLPVMRARDYPLRRNEQILSGASNSDRFIDYPEAGGIMDIAWQAWMEGDWVRAGELSAWIRDYGFAQKDNPQDNGKFAQGHVMQKFHQATQLHTGILHTLGYEDEALAMLEHRLTEMPGGAYWSWHHAHLRFLIWQARRGEVEPGKLAELEKIHPKMKTDKYASDYLAYRNEQAQVWLRYASGDKRGAFEQLASLESGGFADHDNTLELRIALSLREEDTDPALEASFIRLLESYRSAGKKVREPRLYSQYARYLALAGRWSEAIAMQREARRLYSGFGMRARSVEAETVLADYLLRSGASEAAATLLADRDHGETRLPEPIRLQVVEVMEKLSAAGAGSDAMPAVSTSAIDLQPLSVATDTLPGREALAHFTLANPADVAQSGELRLRGPAAELSRDSARNEIVGRLDPSAAVRETTLGMDLKAGEMVVVRLSAPDADMPDAVAAKLFFGEAQSVWRFQTGGEADSVVVTNASRVRENPFYLVPLHHSLFHPDDGSARTADFRIVASEPGRIEVYGAEDGALIYVDANGDGDLGDPGDLLARDTNGNRLPDIDFIEPSRPRSIEVYYDSGWSEEPKARTLTIQMLEDGEWVTHAVNQFESMPR
ncbi:MAG: hypothetical protein ACLFS4_04475 [Opitutales bacterium]